ncbi:ATP-binding protein [Streptomyces sp. NPDC058701]|uniref:ATP-binding protein n=1 Tax=Streptomyces sp. NPDC058701 TaxID=3346608 RepID=UPI0036564764
MNPPEAADEISGPDRRQNGDRPAAPTSATARRVVSELLTDAGISLDSVTAADALLITSELVTNAIRHGGGVIHFHTAIEDDALHVAVSDPSPHPPVPRPTGHGTPGGYGWPLIQRLTEHIDITPLPDAGGKTITTVQRLN